VRLMAERRGPIATLLEPLNSNMTEREVLDRVAKDGHRELPVVDAVTGRMVGIIPFLTSRSLSN
jgi:CBS domain-containing protein